MKKILLFMTYIAGFVVGAKYAKKWSEKKTTQGKNLVDKTVEAGQDFIESHKKAFADLKKEYWTEENKKLLLSKKEDLEKFFHLAQEEFSEALVVLKKHGLDVKAITKHVEEIYEEKKAKLEKLGKTSSAKAAKKKLTDIFTKIKKSVA